MANGDLEIKRWMAYIDDPEHDWANEQLAAVSGQFANFFGDPLVYDDDPDPVDPNTNEITGIVRSWGNFGPVLVRPDEKRAMRQAVNDAQTLAFQEEKAYGVRLIPEAYPMFIAEGQLRQNGSYVRATGLYKTSGTIEQTLTSDFALLTCWDREDLMVNTQRSGDGARFQLAYDGSFKGEVKFQWECDVPFEMQGVINTTMTGTIVSFPLDRPQPFTMNVVQVLAANDRWGIAIRAPGGTGTFRMKQGSWFGLQRIANGAMAAQLTADDLKRIRSEPQVLNRMAGFHKRPEGLGVG